MNTPKNDRITFFERKNSPVKALFDLQKDQMNNSTRKAKNLLKLEKKSNFKR